MNDNKVWRAATPAITKEEATQLAASGAQCVVLCVVDETPEQIEKQVRALHAAGMSVEVAENVDDITHLTDYDTTTPAASWLEFAYYKRGDEDNSNRVHNEAARDGLSDAERAFVWNVQKAVDDLKGGRALNEVIYNTRAAVEQIESQTASGARWRGISTPKSRTTRRGAISKQAAGLQTPLIFTGGGGARNLILPIGALTTIAAPSGHYKSTLCRNLALWLTDATDAPVLMFTTEQSAAESETRLIITGGNLGIETTKDAVYDHNQLIAASGRSVVEAVQATYRRNGDDFKWSNERAERVERLFDGGRLFVFDECTHGRNVDNVVAIVEQFKVEGRAAGAVIVDYIQQLTAGGDVKTGRKEVLTTVLYKLGAMAITHNIPVIVAAQVNRQEGALSPLELTLETIGDAAEIGNDSSVVLLLWNSAREARPKSAYYTAGGLSVEGKKIDKQLHLGKGGRLYIKKAKDRNGEAGVSVVVDVQPSTGYITPSNEARRGDNTPF